MEILSGHGRVLAAKKLNIKNIPVVQYFDMNEEQKRRYRHYANRIADFSRYNLENIQKEILETGDTELLKLYEEFKLTLPETEYDTDNEDIVPTMSTKTPIVQI
jgi:ParB-like chromosome segregation protein Spo0J